jgi:hypothetical protein
MNTIAADFFSRELYRPEIFWTVFSVIYIFLNQYFLDSCYCQVNIFEVCNSKFNLVFASLILDSLINCS